MSLTCSSSISETTACGGLDYTSGEIATMVVAIIGVSGTQSGTQPEVMVSISIRHAMPFLTAKSQADWVADRIEEVLQHTSENPVGPLTTH